MDLEIILERNNNLLDTDDLVKFLSEQTYGTGKDVISYITLFTINVVYKDDAQDLCDYYGTYKYPCIIITYKGYYWTTYYGDFDKDLVKNRVDEQIDYYDLVQ